VEVGHRNTVDAEITGGLREGDRIVLHPSDRVTDGVRIAAR
jgi:HlyD family secretion protein